VCKLSLRGSWKLREHRINTMQQRKHIENGISNETIPNPKINSKSIFVFSSTEPDYAFDSSRATLRILSLYMWPQCAH